MRNVDEIGRQTGQRVIDASPKFVTACIWGDPSNASHRASTHRKAGWTELSAVIGHAPNRKECLDVREDEDAVPPSKVDVLVDLVAIAIECVLRPMGGVLDTQVWKETCVVRLV